jgi:preprotein translocase subunit SecA
MRELERRVLLSVLDRKWREHLYEMDYLRAGIHLRAMANRDPVVEYQREGFDMFNAMLDGIKEESVGFLFNLEVKTQEEQEAEARAKQAEAEARALAAAQEGTAKVLARQAAAAQAAAAGAGNGSVTAPTGPAGTAPAGAAPTARRSGSGKKGKGAVSRAAAVVPPVAEPAKPSGTGPEVAVRGLDEPRRPAQLQYSAPTLDASPKEGGPAKAAKSATVTGTKEPARNAPCPCGSGKKYKVCHGRPGQSL